MTGLEPDVCGSLLLPPSLLISLSGPPASWGVAWDSAMTRPPALRPWRQDLEAKASLGGGQLGPMMHRGQDECADARMLETRLEADACI